MSRGAIVTLVFAAFVAGFIVGEARVYMLVSGQ